MSWSKRQVDGAPEGTRSYPANIRQSENSVVKAAPVRSPAELGAPQRGRHSPWLDSTSTTNISGPTLASPDDRVRGLHTGAPSLDVLVPNTFDAEITGDRDSDHRGHHRVIGPGRQGPFL